MYSSPETSEKKLVRIGRIATCVVVLSGVLWIPFMKTISGELYTYLQSVQAYIAPPIAAVFLLGIFWQKINAQGALVTLIGGFSVGLLRLILEINKDSLSGFWFALADLNFLYFAIFSFLSCTALMIIVSLFTPQQNPKQLNGLTFSTTSDQDKEVSLSSWDNRDLVNSVVIVTILILILIYFSPIGIVT